VTLRLYQSTQGIHISVRYYKLQLNTTPPLLGDMKN